MPSGYLHQTCAAKACAIAGVTPVRTDVMTLGAQGPDPLFMLGIFPLRPSSKPSGLGHLLHSFRTGAFLCALCRRAKDGTAVDRAYALGFLTHYALDSTVHPYVYAHSHKENGDYSSTMHMRLEKHWDSLYYHRDGHTGTSVIMPGAAQTRADWPAVAALWCGAINDAFPEETVTDDMILKALADTEKANRLTHSPSGIKYGIVWALERVIGKPGLGTSQMAPRFPSKGDITNEAHATWRSPFDPERPRTEGLTELYDAGVRRAAELLSAAGKYFGGEMDEDALGAVIGNLGYDTGLESKP